jgi:oleandomycin transport system ATP-binding protein
MDNTIEARGLVKRFGATTALDGVDLTARTGTVLAVLGPNGAGKTTAVRILATLIEPDGGRASVGGHDVVAQAQQVRRLIALTGQYAAVDESLTGVENLLLIGRLLGLSRFEARRRAAELLARFGLADAGGRAAKTYSGHAPPARPGRQPGRPAPGCCTWTSRPPASTLGPAATCGR